MRTTLLGLRSLVLGVVIGVVLAVALPFAAGWRSFTVMSGSMEPAIATGDVVVDAPVAPRDVRAGDVVTFPEPDGGSRLITHRVQSVTLRGDRVDVVTRGDANSVAERWSAAADGRIGRVTYRVPKLGYALVQARTPLGALVLVAVPALLLGGLALVRIWRPRPRPAEA